MVSPSNSHRISHDHLRHTGMPKVQENGKKKRLLYFDLAAALNELRFSKAFGPGILAASFYGLVSGSMSFVNKVVLTSYTYHFPNILMLAQMIIVAFALEAGRLIGYSTIPRYTFDRGRMFFIPSVCFALHTTLALRALDYLSIPMYNVLRRLLPLSSLLFACLMLKKKPSLLVVMSVILVVVGCVTAGFGDLDFTAAAYMSALLSVVCQSFYLTFIQKTGVEKDLSTLTVLHTNSINCIPLLTLYIAFSGELMAAINFNGYYAPGFQAAIIIDVLLGCLLSYSLFLCTTMNSALTTSLVGVVKGVLTTIIGFFTFGGVQTTGLIVVGMILNTIGGFLYSYAKYTEKVTSEIEKHFHKHTLEITVDKTNGTLETIGWKKDKKMQKNGCIPHDKIRVNDVVIEVSDGSSST